MALTCLQLTLEGLFFSYPRRAMFHNLHLRLGTGIHWLRGANGAGKSSLLKLLGGTLEPQAGRMQLGTLQRSASAPDAKQALAWRANSFLCQADTPHLPWLSAQELLDVYFALYCGDSAALHLLPHALPHTAAAALLQTHLQAFGLLPELAQSVASLSLGQHKKLHLALALSLPVSLLLLDEPFNSLDAAAIVYLRQQLDDTVRQARQCIVLTSHLAPEMKLASEIEIEALTGIFN